MTYLKNRIRAFGFAFAGIAQSFSRETHLKLHAIIAFAVIATSLYFNISKQEWLWIALSISLVVAFEMLNSALEKLCDLTTKEQHSTIKYIKDVAAGAVLIVCVFAVIVGLLIFLPYLSN